MELNILQSLAKRQSNEIVRTEYMITLEYDCYRSAKESMDVEHAALALHYARRFKNELKKLVILQKALKKEIASKVHCNRHYDSLTHPDDIFGETFGDMFGKSFFNFSLKDIFKK
jgi:hypothetical protein